MDIFKTNNRYRSQKRDRRDPDLDKVLDRSEPNVEAKAAFIW
jgi:hypothetical protein